MIIDNKLINKKRGNISLVYDNRCDSINNSMSFKLSLLVLIMLLIIPGILGLGITPGRTTINYVPGLEKEIPFSILNNENKSIHLLLTVRGELSDSITLSDNLVNFLPSEDSKQFKYMIKLPNNIADSPGLHKAEIIALEIPKASGEGTFVRAGVSVVSQLYVYVPCPGKCIDSNLYVLGAEEDEIATFIVPVINRGQLGIGEARAVIDIFSKLNEHITSIETDIQPIEPGKRMDLSAKWYVDVLPGDYLAKVTVFYDGQGKSFEKQFPIGNQTLNIEDILISEFVLGEIAKLEIFVENKWSQELEGVFANLLIYNDDGQVMADLRSATETIPPLTKRVLVIYWDTVGVEEGEYNGRLLIKYGERSSDVNVLLRVSSDSLDIVGVGFVTRTGLRKGINIMIILLILIILMLIINLAWFLFFKKMSGKHRR